MLNQETRNEMDKTRGYRWSDDRIREALQTASQLPGLPSEAHAAFAVLMTLRDDYEAGNVDLRAQLDNETETLLHVAEERDALTAELTQARAELERAQNQLDWYAQFDEQHTPPWKAGTPAEPQPDKFRGHGGTATRFSWPP